MNDILIAGIPEQVQNYIAALRAQGMDPSVELSLPADPVSLGFMGLLLPGGSDIDPSFYGQTNAGSRFLHPELDRAQFELLDTFVKAGLPILAICKGHQLVNVFFGGDLIQDLPEPQRSRHPKNKFHEDNVHGTVTIGKSWLTDLYGADFSVNSAHHQGLGKIAPGFSVIQKSDDGVVEAIENPSLPILSVQWHPERMQGAFARDDTVDGSLVFAHFKEMCLKTAEGRA